MLRSISRLEEQALVSDVNRLVSALVEIVRTHNRKWHSARKGLSPYVVEGYLPRQVDGAIPLEFTMVERSTGRRFVVSVRSE